MEKKRLTMSEMPYHFGVKLKLHPSFQQKELIDKNISYSRYVYNKMVATNQRIHYWKNQFVPLIPEELEMRDNIIAILKHNIYSPSNLRKSVPWMIDEKVNTGVINMAIKNYQAAWNMFRKVHNAGVPKFHKKQEDGSFKISNIYKGADNLDLYSGNTRVLDNRHVSTGVIKRVKVSPIPKRLLVNGDSIRIGTTTISRDAVGQYWIAFQLSSETPFVKPVTKTGNALGVDLNTDNFLTDSNGSVVPNPRYYRNTKNKLAKAQRVLSRRARRAKAEGKRLADAKNYQKQKKIVAKIHQDIKNKRRTFLDKVSITLVKNHDLVVAENLQGKNMLKNHALAMSISDVGWSIFTGMMTYKANLYGTKFIKVDPRHTTQTCSSCSFVMTGDNKLTLKDREWNCPNCGEFHIRDHNAAKNILAKGLKIE